MERLSGGPESSYTNATPRNGEPSSISTPMAINLEDGATDDSEWEYEYSTTETETHYLILDLTTTDAVIKYPARPKAGRAGMKARWISTGISTQAPNYGEEDDSGEGGSPGASKPDGDTPQPDEASLQPGPTADTRRAKKQHRPAEAETEDEEDDSEVEHRGRSKQPPAKATAPVDEQEKEPDENEPPKDVHILGLHTDRPVVSYGDDVFSCQWAKIIGTELLFTKHDRENPLPTLRSLPDGVDLLAACSARLISFPATVRTRAEQLKWQTAPQPSKYEKIKAPTVDIPVGYEASDIRKDQAHFLERIGRLKRGSGDQDRVTIIAKKRQTNREWRLIVQERRKATRRRLHKIVRNQGDSDEANEAMKKLAEMDLEDEILKRDDEARGLDDEGMFPQGRKRKQENLGDTSPPKRHRVIIRRPEGGLANFLTSTREAIRHDDSENGPMQQPNGETPDALDHGNDEAEDDEEEDANEDKPSPIDESDSDSREGESLFERLEKSGFFRHHTPEAEDNDDDAEDDEEGDDEGKSPDTNVHLEENGRSGERQ